MIEFGGEYLELPDSFSDDLSEDFTVDYFFRYNSKPCVNCAKPIPDFWDFCWKCIEKLRRGRNEKTT